MDIADIKRWQWVLIGIIAGLGLGWVWSGMEPSEGGGNRSAKWISSANLGRKYQDQPLIQNIIIQPVTNDYGGKKVQPVSFRLLQIGQKSKKIYYVPSQFIAMVPYKPIINAPASMSAQFTLSDYLANLQRRDSNVRYSYGWWLEKPATIGLWTLGAVAIIGGFWPTFLNLIVGAGLGGAPRKRRRKIISTDSVITASLKKHRPPKWLAMPSISGSTT